MSIISQTIFSPILGAVCGALVFSLFFIICLYICMLFDIPVRLGEDGFIGSSQIENPLRAGLLGGTIIGGIQGFLTGLVIGISDTDSLPKGALAGFIVAECLIFGIYFFISVFSNPNFLYLILDLIKNNLSALLKISLTLIIPSAMTGLILAKIISSISHSQS